MRSSFITICLSLLVVVLSILKVKVGVTSRHAIPQGMLLKTNCRESSRSDLRVIKTKKIGERTWKLVCKFDGFSEHR